MSNQDPISNAIYQGIKRGIQVSIENECFGSAVVLIYSGIDSLAYLGIPGSREEVRGSDFIDWCDHYMRFPGANQVTGLELYSARCAVLHTYGVESRHTRKHSCRKIGYMSDGHPPIAFSETVDPSFAIVSIKALANAFYQGVDRYLMDLFRDSSRKDKAEERLKTLLVSIPPRGND